MLGRCSHLWLAVPSCRLWDTLVGQDQDELLFCSYEAIAARSSQLVKDRRVLETQLAAPMAQLPALESATEKLYRLLYNNSNQLQLCSPVSKDLWLLSVLLGWHRAASHSCLCHPPGLTWVGTCCISPY